MSCIRESYYDYLCIRYIILNYQRILLSFLILLVVMDTIYEIVLSIMSLVST